MTLSGVGLAGAAALAAVSLVVSGCTGGEPTGASVPTPSVSTATPSPTPSAEPSAAERVQQLLSAAPRAFLARYRLNAAGRSPDATVTMRMAGERFRLDIAHGRTTAALIHGRRGVVACQVERPDQGRPTQACFLVAAGLGRLPTLFDPGIHRLFGSTTKALARGAKGVTVHRAGTWQAPGGLGVAECFAVKGMRLDSGTYCYLAEPGRFRGLLARADFPSGTLRLRQAGRALPEGVFHPPVHPTPLPTG